jgi:RNA polymerase sigma factor (sigma-70 family)
MDDLSELVVRAQQGDSASYATLVQRFRRMVITYAYARLGDFQLAEDVAQEVFLQASFDLPSLRAPGAFASWLRQIVLKYCDRVTRRKRRPMLPLEQARMIASSQSEPLQVVEQRELRGELLALIAGLPTIERESVLLCDLGGHSQGELAAFLGVPATTVRKRLQRARARLRLQLQSPGGARPAAPVPLAITVLPWTWEGALMMEDLSSVGEPLTIAIRAIKRGDQQQLATLLAAHPALARARSSDGRSLLGHLTDYPANIVTGPALVQVLVAVGAAVDDLALNTAQGETPLQWAVSANDVAVAAALLSAGAAVDGPQGDGRPLSQALFYGQRAAAELLVQHGARLTLAFAAGLGRVDQVEACFDAAGRLLPQAGRHVPPVNQFVAASGTTAHDELLEQALVYATINGQVAVIDALVQRGATIDALPSGFDIRLTALHWAVVRDQSAAVAALLTHGADREIMESQHQATALGWAIYHKREAIAALLRSRGASGQGDQ